MEWRSRQQSANLCVNISCKTCTSLDILVSDPYTVEIWGASWPFVSCNTRRVRKHVFQPQKKNKNFEGSKMIGTRHGTNMGP